MSRKFVLILVAAVMFFAIAPALQSAQAQEPINLKFWHTYNQTSPENEMLVGTLIPAFEAANPGITVESVPFPYGEFRQTMLTALAGSEGPDLARVDIIWSPEFAKLGVLAPLSDVMPDWQELADRVFPGPLSTNFYNGKYWGLPLDTNTRVFMTNPTIYEQAGLTAAPTTVDELIAQCEAVKALGEDYYLYSDGGTYGWAVLPWIWSFGGDIVNEDMTTSEGFLNGEKTVAAYEFMADMVNSGCFSDGMTGSGFDSGANYFQDKVASIMDGPWMFPIAEAQYPDFEIQTAPLPAGEGGSISVVGGENIVMFANTAADDARRDAALAFLRFTQSDEYQLKMSETGQLTVVPALLENEYFQTHPYFGTFLEQLQTARARLPHPNWNNIEQVLTDVGQVIVRGEMSAQEALDIAVEEVDALLADN